MTAYNREKYIAAAIESVLASTLTDFELIIVDDGSKDNTVAIAKSYALKDDRISVYQNENNLGDYPNRNKAASYATGKYLKYLDSDDLIYTYGLKVFVDSMEKFPEAAVGVTAFTGQEEQPYPFMLNPAEAYDYHFYKRELFDTGPSGLIFHARRFREIGGFSGKRYVGDTEMNLRLAASKPVVRIAGSLIFWRQHEGQEIVAGNNLTGYTDFELPMYTAELTRSDCPLPKDKSRKVINYYRRITARHLVKVGVVKKQPALAFRMYKKLGLTISDLVSGLVSAYKRY